MNPEMTTQEMLSYVPEGAALIATIDDNTHVFHYEAMIGDIVTGKIGAEEVTLSVGIISLPPSLVERLTNAKLSTKVKLAKAMELKSAREAILKDKQAEMQARKIEKQKQKLLTEMQAEVAVLAGLVNTLETNLDAKSYRDALDQMQVVNEQFSTLQVNE